MALRSLKYSYVGKEYNVYRSMRIWNRITVFFHENLRISDLWTGTPKKSADLRINHYKFADLRFAD
jgi:hypothetical protein